MKVHEPCDKKYFESKNISRLKLELIKFQIIFNLLLNKIKILFQSNFLLNIFKYFNFNITKQSVYVFFKRVPKYNLIYLF